MNNVCVFQSREFDPEAGWDEGTGRQRSPAGRDCAEYVARALAEQGVSLDPNGPVEGETAWLLYPQVAGNTYEIMVSWAIPITNDDRRQFWAIFVGAKRGVLRALFAGRRFGDDDVRPLREIVDRALALGTRDGVIGDVTWMSDEEFWTRYAC